MHWTDLDTANPPELSIFPNVSSLPATFSFVLGSRTFVTVLNARWPFLYFSES